MQTEWTCEVYLRLARHTKEIPFGSPITVKSEVEERIRRAQLAILNPSKSHIEFLNSGIQPDHHEVSFSRDLISVRITGRDVDDLSFVDLPGMNLDICENHADTIQGSFNQSEMVDGKQTLKRSKALSLALSRSRAALSCLLSHAKVSSSLPGYNLLTFFFLADLENQGARRLAKQVDPSGNRTIRALSSHPPRMTTNIVITQLSLPSPIALPLASIAIGWSFLKINKSVSDMGGTASNSQINSNLTMVYPGKMHGRMKFSFSKMRHIGLA
jgi:hypothetical protein